VTSVTVGELLTGDEEDENNEDNEEEEEDVKKEWTEEDEEAREELKEVGECVEKEDVECWPDTLAGTAVAVGSTAEVGALDDGKNGEEGEDEAADEDDGWGDDGVAMFDAEVVCVPPEAEDEVEDEEALEADADSELSCVANEEDELESEGAAAEGARPPLFEDEEEGDGADVDEEVPFTGSKITVSSVGWTLPHTREAEATAVELPNSWWMSVNKPVQKVPVKESNARPRSMVRVTLGWRKREAALNSSGTTTPSALRLNRGWGLLVLR
jgi:hypothetical protein